MISHFPPHLGGHRRCREGDWRNNLLFWVPCSLLIKVPLRLKRTVDLVLSVGKAGLSLGDQTPRHWTLVPLNAFRRRHFGSDGAQHIDRIGTPSHWKASWGVRFSWFATCNLNASGHLCFTHWNFKAYLHSLGKEKPEITKTTIHYCSNQYKLYQV